MERSLRFIFSRIHGFFSSFKQRIFSYNYRIFDRYRLPVATLVILADDRPAWRPNNYEYQLWKTQMGLKFPVVKLLDYDRSWSTLETSDNPMAVMVMAHLKSYYGKSY